MYVFVFVVVVVYMLSSQRKADWQGQLKDWLYCFRPQGHQVTRRPRRYSDLICPDTKSLSQVIPQSPRAVNILSEFRKNDFEIINKCFSRKWFNQTRTKRRVAIVP